MKFIKLMIPNYVHSHGKKKNKERKNARVMHIVLKKWQIYIVCYWIYIWIIHVPKKRLAGK
jgi:hypothetical protein